MATHPNRRRATAAAVAAVAAAPLHDDRPYNEMLNSMCATFIAATSNGQRLFCTDVTGLNEIYLDNLAGDRQHHNCHACRRFIETFGGLVTITESGVKTSPFWNCRVPSLYDFAFDAMESAVDKARITGVFLSQLEVWGTPQTGQWSHMAVPAAGGARHLGGALDAHQKMAALRENKRLVAAALDEFPAAALDQAIRILEADAVSRAERFLAPVQWLRALQDRPKGPRGDNLLWRAVASAPDGYCHPRASMTGSLLVDIISGLPFEDIQRRFNAKMHPLQYQRPQAAPTAGNIEAAEKLVAKLGLAPSLERRFARLEDLQTIWRPTPAAQPAGKDGGGVFGHLQPKAAAPAVREVDLPPVTMTWVKFKAEVMPKATAIEIRVPAHGAFVALTAAQNPEAPPIMKWDREDARNTVALYVYHRGSPARQWGLNDNAWRALTAITPHPWLWGDRPMPHISEGDTLVIEGAVDNRSGAGTALFPEFLREELREVRATIEAFSKTAEFHGRAEASACGWSLTKGNTTATLRAQVGGAWNRYTIDRWD